MVHLRFSSKCGHGYPGLTQLSLGISMFGFNLKALDYYLVLNKRPVPNKQPGGEILKRQVKIHPSLLNPNKRWVNTGID